MAFITHQGKPLGENITTEEADDFIFGMVIFNELLGTKRDEHTNDDDADLTRKLTPAVQRFRQMEMHTGPRLSAEANRSVNVRNGSKAYIAVARRRPGSRSPAGFVPGH